MDDEVFWEIASGLDGDQERTKALDVLAGERTTFAGALRRVPAGEVVTLIALDGVAIRGRVLGVGADHVQLGEVVDDLGAARARTVRTHDLRLAAIVRMVRERER